MKEPETKQEIIAWYKKARRSIELRVIDAHPVLWKISRETYDVYDRSIEDHFRRLKEKFNKRLKEKKNAGTAR